MKSHVLNKSRDSNNRQSAREGASTSASDIGNAGQGVEATMNEE